VKLVSKPMLAEESAEEDVFEREVMDNFVNMRQSARGVK
jgi:hypothetical protein